MLKRRSPLTGEMIEVPDERFKTVKDVYIDVEELDDLIEHDVDPELLVKFQVMYHNDKLHPLVILRGMIHIVRPLVCEWCHNPDTYTMVYMNGGMHEGAWCYAYDFDGEYLANLRDESFMCSECEEKKRLEKLEKLSKIEKD